MSCRAAWSSTFPRTDLSAFPGPRAAGQATAFAEIPESGIGDRESGIRKRFRFVLLFRNTKETRNGNPGFPIPDSGILMSAEIDRWNSPRKGGSQERLKCHITTLLPPFQGEEVRFGHFG